MIIDPPLAEDLLEGAREIATFLYGNADDVSKVRRAIRTRQIPVFKIGGTVCARRSTILRWITTQELSSFG